MLLHSETQGQGQPVVLIPGMASSSRYWQDLIPTLSREFRVVAIDLLGFGRSPKPKKITYNLETHLNSIAETLVAAGVKEPAIVVGHSMGSLLALQLAIRFPQKVSQLVLINTPVYSSPEAAKRAITRGRRALELAYYGWTSNLLCHVWCRFLRPLSRHVAPLYLRHLPKSVAQDSLLHTWRAYSQTLHYVIENQNVPADLAAVKVPILAIYGDQDPALQTLPATLRSSRQPKWQLIVMPGSHHLPLEKPAELAAKIIEVAKKANL